MNGIRLRLDPGEHDAIARFAAAVGVSPEDVAYAALNRLMQNADDPCLRRDIAETSAWRKNNLPLWSDSAHSVHVYESKHDDPPEPPPPPETAPR
ncbi:MAG TPA: hypothetical protein VHE13_16865 [Opitutus sp.]|nr:hypothetical protein [Opitutus sp.]